MHFFGPDTVQIVVATVAAVAILGTGGALTEIGPWYANLRKPSWQPPNWLFAPAWTVIFALAAYAAVVAWDAAPNDAARALIVVLFALNGALNIVWSLFFFRMRRPDWALIEIVPLWLSIVALIAVLSPLAAAAGVALLPYLFWVSFASVLNRAIVRLNAPFGRGAPQEKHATPMGSQR